MLDVKALLTKILNSLPNKSNKLVVEGHSNTISLPASESTAVVINMEKSGYTFLGVVGFTTSGTGSSLGYVYAQYKYTDTQARLMFRNTTGTARTYTVTAYGLYVKN